MYKCIVRLYAELYSGLDFLFTASYVCNEYQYLLHRQARTMNESLLTTRHLPDPFGMSFCSRSSSRCFPHLIYDNRPPVYAISLRRQNLNSISDSGDWPISPQYPI